MTILTKPFSEKKDKLDVPLVQEDTPYVDVRIFIFNLKACLLL